MQIVKIAASRQEVIAKLFVDDSGKVIFSAMPTAICKDASSPEDLFNDWYEFDDYIVEGYVKYQVKFEEQGNAVEMFTKLCGTPRDLYVASALKSYVKAAGLSIIG